MVNIMICMFNVYTLLLADVSENFGEKCIKIYELYSTDFVSEPRLAL